MSDVLPDTDIPEPIIPDHPDCERMIEGQSTDEFPDVNETENGSNGQKETENPAESALKVI